MASILHLPILRWLCDNCGRVFIRADHRNDPAYCKYECGAQAQPDKVITHYEPGGRVG